jgi:hypothetical protein
MPEGDFHPSVQYFNNRALAGARSADVSSATGILPGFRDTFHFSDNPLATKNTMVFRRIPGSGNSGRDALAAGTAALPAKRSLHTSRDSLPKHLIPWKGDAPPQGLCGKKVFEMF